MYLKVNKANHTEKPSTSERVVPNRWEANRWWIRPHLAAMRPATGGERGRRLDGGGAKEREGDFACADGNKRK